MKQILVCAALSGVALMAMASGPPTQTDSTVNPAVLYSCVRDGVRHYISSYPLPTDRDCRAIPYRRALAPGPSGNSFHGYACKSDCSGHQAGYDWAYRRGTSSYAGCTGNSQSFIEGCRAYVDQMNSRAKR